MRFSRCPSPAQPCGRARLRIGLCCLDRFTQMFLVYLWRWRPGLMDAWSLAVCSFSEVKLENGTRDAWNLQAAEVTDSRQEAFSAFPIERVSHVICGWSHKHKEICNARLIPLITQHFIRCWNDRSQNTRCQPFKQMTFSSIRKGLSGPVLGAVSCGIVEPGRPRCSSSGSINQADGGSEARSWVSPSWRPKFAGNAGHWWPIGGPLVAECDASDWLRSLRAEGL